jgi:hypothetical protein
MKTGKWLIFTNRCVLMAVALCGLAASAYSSVILSENFNELTPTAAATSVGAFHTINGTNVDIVGGAFFGSLCVAPESGNCIDMNGSGGNPQGQLQSNMLFSPGSYLLSFDLIGSSRGNTASVTVTLGNYNQTFTLASNNYTGGIVTDQPVTLASPDHLLFASDIPGDVGLLLDNVVVATAVPEPASLLPLGLAFLAGSLMLVRRRVGKQG